MWLEAEFQCLELFTVVLTYSGGLVDCTRIKVVQSQILPSIFAPEFPAEYYSLF
jgi:hypothetical protein